MKLSGQYGLSTLGKTIPIAAADAFSLYFYTDIAGITPALAGTMVLVTLSWSALCDPLAGWVQQTRQVRAVAPRSYFLYGTIAATLFFLASFSRPFAGDWLWPVLLGAAMLFRLAYALIDVPHNALLGRLQEQGQSPVRLGALRLGATIAGTFVVIGAAQFALGGAAWRFTVFAMLTGCTGAILFLGFFPYPALRDFASPGPHPAVAHAGFRNAHAAGAALFLTAVAATIINGLFSKDIVYIAKYVLHAQAWTVTGLALFTAGKIAGTPFWIWFSEKRGITGTMGASFVLIAATGAGVALTPPAFSYLGTALFFFGAGIAGTNIAGWALMPDCASLFPSRHQPLFFGLFTAANKIASGLSGAIVGYTLAMLNIDAGATSQQNQTEGLYWLVYVYPIAGSVLGIAGIALYRGLRRFPFRLAG